MEGNTIFDKDRLGKQAVNQRRDNGMRFIEFWRVFRRVLHRMNIGLSCSSPHDSKVKKVFLYMKLFFVTSVFFFFDFVSVSFFLTFSLTGALSADALFTPALPVSFFFAFAAARLDDVLDDERLLEDDCCFLLFLLLLLLLLLLFSSLFLVK